MCRTMMLLLPKAETKNIKNSKLLTEIKLKILILDKKNKLNTNVN